MSCLHLHLCQWCQPDALGTEALCPDVGCWGVLQLRGWVSQELGGKAAVTECSAPREAMSWGWVCSGKACTARTCPGSLSCPHAASCLQPSTALPLSAAGETAFRCGAGRDARLRHTGEQQKL